MAYSLAEMVLSASSICELYRPARLMPVRQTLHKFLRAMAMALMLAFWMVL